MSTNLLGAEVLPVGDGANVRAFFWENALGAHTATIRAVYERKDGTWFLLANLRGELADWPAVACRIPQTPSEVETGFADFRPAE